MLQRRIWYNTAAAPFILQFLKEIVTTEEIEQEEEKRYSKTLPKSLYVELDSIPLILDAFVPTFNRLQCNSLVSVREGFLLR